MDILIVAVVYIILFFSVFKFYHFLRSRKNKTILYNTTEIIYLSNKYKLDIKKIGISKMLNIVALANALIFSITLSVTGIINNLTLRLLVMFVVLFPLIYFTYHFIGKYYQKKGMIKNV